MRVAPEDDKSDTRLYKILANDVDLDSRSICRTHFAPVQQRKVHMWILCFFDGVQRICVRIPILIEWYWGLKPPPPPPWIEGKRIEPDMAKYLQTLATIDRVAAELPAQYARDIQRTVEAHIQSIGKTLGEGVEISRRAEQA